MRGSRLSDVRTSGADMSAEGFAGDGGHGYLFFLGQLLQLLGELVVDSDVKVLH